MTDTAKVLMHHIFTGILVGLAQLIILHPKLEAWLVQCFIPFVMLNWMWQKVYLQGSESLEHVFPHAYLHIKLRQFFVCLCAYRSNLLGRTDILGEIEDMARCWWNTIKHKVNHGCQLLHLTWFVYSGKSNKIRMCTLFCSPLLAGFSTLSLHSEN